MIAYPVTLKRDTNQTILVTSRDFPELVTFGEDRQDALRKAVGAFEEAIAARIAHHEQIPKPSKFKASAPHVILPTRIEAMIRRYLS